MVGRFFVVSTGKEVGWKLKLWNVLCCQPLLKVGKKPISISQDYTHIMRLLTSSELPLIFIWLNWHMRCHPCSPVIVGHHNWQPGHSCLPVSTQIEALKSAFLFHSSLLLIYKICITQVNIWLQLNVQRFQIECLNYYKAPIIFTVLVKGYNGGKLTWQARFANIF